MAARGVRPRGLRSPDVYGAHQNIADRYRNLIMSFMNDARCALSMPVFGDGLQTRVFCDLHDVAAVIARTPVVRASANQPYDIGVLVKFAREITIDRNLPPSWARTATGNAS